MAFEWIIIFIAAIVGTRPKRTRKDKDILIPADNSETESEDWETTVEGAKEIATDKGKAPMKSIPMKKKSVARKRTQAAGITIEEPLAGEPPPQVEEFVHISSRRMKDFEKRECIGERHVNVGALRERSAAFSILFDQAGFSQICKFSETTGYCLHLVRTFYTCAQQLQENENGPMEFYTAVRNVKLKVTPQLVGEVLGMKPQLSGEHYMKGQYSSTVDWKTVVDGICMPDTRSAGNSIRSNELRPEYRFLHFIVCYNILPNMQTKVLRWDRMLYLYLLGHPTAARGLNFNIPYLIWSRMSRYVEQAHPTERLPFPLIIMRILRKFDVDTRSSSYLHSLGTINDTTIVKSLTQRPHEMPTPPRSKQPSTSSPQPPVGSDDEASVTSIYREQQRLSSEQERISMEQERIAHDIQQISASQKELKKKNKFLTKLVKKIFKKLGCSSSEESDSD